jgi:hypothetical protein
VDESLGGKQTVRVEDYTGAPITAAFEALTIAQIYRAVDGRSGSIAAAELTYRCFIDAAGRVEAYACKADDPATPADPVIDGLVRASGALQTIQTFPPVTQSAKVRTDRYVTFTVRVPAIDFPTIDLSSGPLVESNQIPLLADRSLMKLDYPARALRQELEGRSTIECQVQQDLSLICRQIAFEPAEDGAVFAKSAERAFGGKALQDLKLADGSDARGVRFQMRLTWSIR